MKIKELLYSEDRWTQSYFAVNEYGDYTYSLSPTAVAWCLTGAVVKCYSKESERIEVMQKLLDAGDFRSIGVSVWNDDKTRTFEEVRALVEKCDV